MSDVFYEIEIVGRTPIMFYNPRLSDPLDEYTRELKRLVKKGGTNKSEAEHMEVSRTEFQGALHFHDGEDGRKAMGPFVPSEMLEAVAKANAPRGLGKRVGDVLRADDPVGFKLEYEGPRTRDGLWKAGTFSDRRSASPNKKTRVMRTRPIFRHWRCKFVVYAENNELDAEQIRDLYETAGNHGMGSYHKRFGRFEVVSFKKLGARTEQAAAE